MHILHDVLFPLSYLHPSAPSFPPQFAAKRATVYLLLPEQPPLASDAPPYYIYTLHAIFSPPV